MVVVMMVMGDEWKRKREGEGTGGRIGWRKIQGPIN